MLFKRKKLPGSSFKIKRKIQRKSKPKEGPKKNIVDKGYVIINRLNTTVFPLNAVSPTNLVQILGKMGYREATRMRRTCRDIDEFIDRNRQHFKFPVERVTFLFDWSELLTKRRRKTRKVWEQWFEMNDRRWPSLQKPSPRYGIPDNGLFESISVVCHSTEKTVNGKPILEYIEKSNIRCHKLNVMKKLANQIDLVELYKASKASTVFVGRYRFGRNEDKPIPLQLDIVKELANLKCQALVIELCEELPDEYVEILSKFAVINIGAIENDQSPSLAPLIKLMMSDLVFPLKSFLLPVYDEHLSREEMKELQMEKWRLKQGRHVLPAGCFLIDSPNYYILLWQHGETSTEHRCGHRIPKSDIELLVSKWISHYYHLPIDVSNLYEYILNNQNNYDGIKEQMEKLLDSSYSETAPTEVRAYYMC